MLKKITKLLLMTFLYIQCAQYVEAACEHGYFGNGDGSIENPYEVRNDSDFTHISYVEWHDPFQPEIIAVDHRRENYKQIKDVKLQTPLLDFYGVYDGQNYSIDVSDVKAEGYYVFFTIQTEGEVKNLKLIGNITTNVFGGVALINNGVIRNTSANCFNILEQNILNQNKNLRKMVYGENIGGFVSENNGLIEDCANNSNVVENEAAYAIGGFAGINSGTIRRCVNNGKISGGGDRKYGLYGGYVGGIVGYNAGVVEDCYNTGEVMYSNQQNYGLVGGIVGMGDGGYIENNYNVGSVTSKGETSSGSNGGIIGGTTQNSLGNIINNYYLGTAQNVNGYSLAEWDKYKKAFKCNGVRGDSSGTIKYTDNQMKSQTLVDLLNSGRNVWKLGISTYPYPMYRRYIAVQISPSQTNIGDNTPISLNLSYEGDIDQFTNISVLVNGIPQQTFSGHLNFLSTHVSGGGDIKVQVVLMDNATSVFTSNIVTFNKRNLLETTLTATLSAQPNTFLILDDVDRYYENNANNQSLVQGILDKKVGIFLIYNNVSDVLVPLLKP